MADLRETSVLSKLNHKAQSHGRVCNENNNKGKTRIFNQKDGL